MDSKQFRSKELPIEAALRSTSGEGLSSVDATVERGWVAVVVPPKGLYVWPRGSDMAPVALSMEPADTESPTCSSRRLRFVALPGGSVVLVYLATNGRIFEKKLSSPTKRTRASGPEQLRPCAEVPMTSEGESATALSVYALGVYIVGTSAGRVLTVRRPPGRNGAPVVTAVTATSWSLLQSAKWMLNRLNGDAGGTVANIVACAAQSAFYSVTRSAVTRWALGAGSATRAWDDKLSGALSAVNARRAEAQSRPLESLAVLDMTISGNNELVLLVAGQPSGGGSADGKRFHAVLASAGPRSTGLIVRAASAELHRGSGSGKMRLDVAERGEAIFVAARGRDWFTLLCDRGDDKGLAVLRAWNPARAGAGAGLIGSDDVILGGGLDATKAAAATGLGLDLCIANIKRRFNRVVRFNPVPARAAAGAPPAGPSSSRGARSSSTGAAAAADAASRSSSLEGGPKALCNKLTYWLQVWERQAKGSAAPRIADAEATVKQWLQRAGEGAWAQGLSRLSDAIINQLPNTGGAFELGNGYVSQLTRKTRLHCLLLRAVQPTWKYLTPAARRRLAENAELVKCAIELYKALALRARAARARGDPRDSTLQKPLIAAMRAAIRAFREARAEVCRGLTAREVFFSHVASMRGLVSALEGAGPNAAGRAASAVLTDLVPQAWVATKVLTTAREERDRLKDEGLTAGAPAESWTFSRAVRDAVYERMLAPCQALSDQLRTDERRAREAFALVSRLGESLLDGYKRYLASLSDSAPDAELDAEFKTRRGVILNTLRTLAVGGGGVPRTPWLAKARTLAEQYRDFSFLVSLAVDPKVVPEARRSRVFEGYTNRFGKPFAEALFAFFEARLERKEIGAEALLDLSRLRPKETGIFLGLFKEYLSRSANRDLAWLHAVGSHDFARSAKILAPLVRLERDLPRRRHLASVQKLALLAAGEPVGKAEAELSEVKIHRILGRTGTLPASRLKRGAVIEAAVKGIASGSPQNPALAGLALRVLDAEMGDALRSAAASSAPATRSRQRKRLGELWGAAVKSSADWIQEQTRRREELPGENGDGVRAPPPVVVLAREACMLDGEGGAVSVYETAFTDFVNKSKKMDEKTKETLRQALRDGAAWVKAEGAGAPTASAAMDDEPLGGATADSKNVTDGGEFDFGDGLSGGQFDFGDGLSGAGSSGDPFGFGEPPATGGGDAKHDGPDDTAPFGDTTNSGIGGMDVDFGR